MNLKIIFPNTGINAQERKIKMNLKMNLKNNYYWIRFRKVAIKDWGEVTKIWASSQIV